MDSLVLLPLKQARSSFCVVHRAQHLRKHIVYDLLQPSFSGLSGQALLDKKAPTGQRSNSNTFIRCNNYQGIQSLHQEKYTIDAGTGLFIRIIHHYPDGLITQLHSQSLQQYNALLLTESVYLPGKYTIN